ncbi:MAG: hypothetical protein ACFFDP_08590 [Promethearchaeota archaeon]
MRDTNSDTPKHWITSTNRPYQLLAAVWITLGILFIAMVTIDFVSRFFHQIFSSYFYTLHLVFVAMGIFCIINASLLFYDSRTIHKNPFPEESQCQKHPEQQAYDRCAICGKLYCPKDLVRIQQKTWGFSPGMFGFDGVACQKCAQNRVKQFSVISIIFLTIIPLLFFINICLTTTLPIQFTGIFIPIFGAAIIILDCIYFCFLEKLWRLIKTPLTKNPEQMKTTEERLIGKIAES